VGGTPPVFTVSDFVAVFNQSLDMMYPQVSVVGELANFRISKGMWVYFDLKDEYASVKFFGTVRALPGPLEEGMILEVIGKPYLHPKFGFSIQFQAVQAVGEGSIKKAQQLLAAKLDKEGLFDPARKRVLPFPPTKIGLITSKESAAYGDFVKIIKDRWPTLAIELFNVQVQGADAPGQIIEGIEEANQKVDQLEVLVMIRGGGSSDDLAAFDHEQVVRAVASSRIPTLVAVGHERDVSLSELAADVRASTPSNAAEILVPDRTHENQVLDTVSRRLDELLFDKVRGRAEDIKAFKQAFTDLLELKLQTASTEISHRGQFLAALNPKAPLARGYALARKKDGQVIRLGIDAERLENFILEFSDKVIEVRPKE
jgi:exodeoxyribonuclease VII large subunit